MPKKTKSSSQVPLLEATNITKRFGQFTANDNVGFTINKGEIYALLGENGAGKSTFVKMLYGVQAPDDGQFIWEGQPVQITSPKAARAMGIAMVFQHFSLFPALTVAENIALALDDAPQISALSKRIIEASERWGFLLSLTALWVIFRWGNNSGLKFYAVFCKTLSC